MSFDLTLLGATIGPNDIDGQTLVGIVTTSGYVFQIDHTSADDVTDWEVGDRLSGTASASSDPDTGIVTVDLESITTDVDLSGEPDAYRLNWFIDGATDADRLFVGSSIDESAAGNGTYSPTYDDGLYTLSALETVTVTVDGGDDL